jgi:glycosyltransferase involved in cell wall biosynthesis
VNVKIERYVKEKAERMSNMLTNIFYIGHLQEIGGVETYLYEIAKKYENIDITVIYNTADQKQLNRLKRKVRCIKYNNETIECEKAFFNYDISIIDNVKAKKYVEIIHADYVEQNIVPHIHPKIDEYYGVSEIACKSFTQLTGLKCELLRNPLTIDEEDSKRVLFLVSATRLSKGKGKDRMIKLIDELTINQIPFLWLIFTTDTNAIDNPNIIYMKPRLDVRQYINAIKGKGYGVQLSDSEGDCYFTRECEAFGVPVLVTQCPSFKTQGIEDGINGYYLDFDMKNIDINKIYNNIPEYEGYINQDKWNEILINKKSNYKEEIKMKYLVEATNKYVEKNVFDGELTKINGKKYIPKKGEQWIVTYERKEVLVNNGFAKEVKEISEIEKAVKDVNKETAVKPIVKTATKPAVKKPVKKSK